MRRLMLAFMTVLNLAGGVLAQSPEELPGAAGIGDPYYALRLRMSDEAFFDILRTYYTSYAYGTASTEDFTAVAEELSGQDLGDFFNGWLYQRQMPDIREMGTVRVAAP